MALEKIDPKTLEFNKLQHFYRAIPQGFAESAIFYMTKESGHSCYMARSGNGGTFVTNDFQRSLGYGSHWSAIMSSKGIPFPFTEYITLFEIDVRPYLDRLYRDTSGNEGIVIRGPIELQDIKVLLSADTNILDRLELKGTLLPSRLLNVNLISLSQRKADLLHAAGDSPDTSLVRRYYQDKKNLVEQIHAYFESLPPIHPHPSKNEIERLLPQVVFMFGASPKCK